MPHRAVALLVFVTLARAVHAQESAPPAERVSEIRIHGNARIADTDVLRMAGIAVGDSLPPDAIDQIKQRLLETDRFEDVDIRKRFRSMTDPTDIALVIVVHERPPAPTGSVLLRPLKTLHQHAMFLPILGYTDGYGLTYGAQVGAVDMFGFGERLSVPLTWGATKRAEAKLERQFKKGPIDRVEGGGGIRSRENPRFNLTDTRTELRARAEHYAFGALRLGAEVLRNEVSFGTTDDSLWSFTTDATVDTRNDPSFPRTGFWARASWTGLHVAQRDRINKYQAEVRAYRPVIGQMVFAVRGIYTGADATLPSYERLLLGGGSSLRGYRAGSFDGDRLAVASAELRVPWTGPLGVGRTGFTIFADTGAAYEYTQSLSKVQFHRGIGAGLFFSAAVFSLNFDVARSDAGSNRGHVSFGFNF